LRDIYEGDCSRPKVKTTENPSIKPNRKVAGLTQKKGAAPLQ
jgi:hypothetical protein